MTLRILPVALSLACGAWAAPAATEPVRHAAGAPRHAPAWSAVAPFPAPFHAGARFEYTVTVRTLSDPVLHIALQVSGWPDSVLRLRSVPRYLDNPTPAADAGAGTAMGPLRAFDHDGRNVAVRRTRAPRGNSYYDVRVRDGSTRVEYDLTVAFRNSRQTSRYPIQIPFLRDGRAWLYGNCVFASPEVAPGERQSLRTPLDVRVRFATAPGIALVGPDSAVIQVPNAYALLSLQFGFGAFHVEPVPSADARIAVAFPDTVQVSRTERRALRSMAARIVGCVGRFFGQAPYPSVTFYFFRGPGVGGQEGAYALQTYGPAGLSLTDSTGRAGAFRRVALHEYFHTWTPITLFADNDPWIKEGLTSYYGNVLGARLGWLGRDERAHLFDRFKRVAARNPRLGRIALTDPRIWDHEYDDESWRTLTYERGMAVSLLLDVWIREQTQNARSLDDVLRLLGARHAHRSVSHADLIQAVREVSGADASPWFARWIEGVEVPTGDAVQAGLERASELGVFEPGGVPVAPTR